MLYIYRVHQPYPNTWIHSKIIYTVLFFPDFSLSVTFLSVAVMGDEEVTAGVQSMVRLKSPAPFRPLVVLEFAVGAKQPAIEWMISKLQGSEATGGAELEVSAVVMTYKQVT